MIFIILLNYYFIQRNKNNDFSISPVPQQLTSMMLLKIYGTN